MVIQDLNSLGLGIQASLLDSVMCLHKANSCSKVSNTIYLPTYK